MARQVEITSEDVHARVHDYTDGEDPYIIAMVLFDAMLALGYANRTVADMFIDVARDCSLYGAEDSAHIYPPGTK